MPLQNNLLKADVGIIGGGIGGAETARLLAKKGYKVIIFDGNPELLLGSSNVTPGRQGLGFHYTGIETAITLLRKTIEFKREFGFDEHGQPIPNFSIGQNDENPALREGEYYIVKGSLFDKNKILATYEALAQEYAALVQEDPKNEVFGPPSEFYRILAREEYEQHVNADIVDVAVRTKEELLNWPEFRKRLLAQLLDKKHLITVYTNTSVKGFAFDSSSNQYTITAAQSFEGGTSRPILASVDYVVNAAWGGAEKLTNDAGYGPPKDGRTQRLKVLAEVETPQELIHQNSKFFCMGPHCMYSNMGWNAEKQKFISLMSYAPKTNIQSSTAIELPKAMALYLKPDRTPDEDAELQEIIQEQQFAQHIVGGVAKYIPAMKNANILGLRFGIVKTTGTVDIFDHNSPFHERNYSGVEEFVLGFIVNAPMKLLYGPNNAKLVTRLIDAHALIRPLLQEVALFLARKQAILSKQQVSPDIQKALYGIMLKYFSARENAELVLEQPLLSASQFSMQDDINNNALELLPDSQSKPESEMIATQLIEYASVLPSDWTIGIVACNDEISCMSAVAEWEKKNHTPVEEFIESTEAIVDKLATKCDEANPYKASLSPQRTPYTKQHTWFKKDREKKRCLLVYIATEEKWYFHGKDFNNAVVSGYVNGMSALQPLADALTGVTNISSHQFTRDADELKKHLSPVIAACLGFPMGLAAKATLLKNPSSFESMTQAVLLSKFSAVMGLKQGLKQGIQRKKQIDDLNKAALKYYARLNAAKSEVDAIPNLDNSPPLLPAPGGRGVCYSVSFHSQSRKRKNNPNSGQYGENIDPTLHQPYKAHTSLSGELNSLRPSLGKTSST